MDQATEIEMLRQGWTVEARTAKTSMQALRRLLELVHGVDTTGSYSAEGLVRLCDSVIDRHLL